ncbi:YihY family inner membrane protein [Neisseriaceae bacterium PsAf]|nr:YihY family inner membrane protein [Neisseriaceae bacterium PsAf]MCV2503133.1 YihY family inner membrane protein [Neisseriaceae bacterium]
MSSQGFLQKLKQNRLFNFLQFLINRFKHFDIGYSAASLTLSTLTALVPTVTFLIYLFSNTPAFEQFSGQILIYIASFLESSAFNAITDYLGTIPDKIGNLSIIAAGILLISASFLMSVIETTFNKIWQVEKPRHFFWRVLIYLLVIIIGPLSIAIVSSFWNFYVKNLDFIEVFPLLSNLSYSLVSLLLYTLVIFLMFRLIPYRYVPNTDALLGAFITSLALIIIKKIFTLYVLKFNRYELIYGAFAAIPLFILYVYILWYTLLSGAVLTSSLSHFKNNAFKKQNISNNQFEDAIRVLSQLSHSSKNNKGFKIQEIRKSVTMGYDALGQLLDRLQQLGYTKKELLHWKLNIDPEEIKLSDLFDEFVIPANPIQKDLCGKTLYSLIKPGFENLDISLEDFLELEKQVKKTTPHDTPY